MGTSYGFLFSIPSGVRVMPSIDYRRLRDVVGMAEVLSLVGFVPRSQRGGQLRGICPCHDSQSDRSPTFSVNVEKGTFRCFKCNAEGNQLDLWARVSKQPLHQAALDLCDRLHVEVPQIVKHSRTEKRNP